MTIEELALRKSPQGFFIVWLTDGEEGARVGQDITLQDGVYVEHYFLKSDDDFEYVTVEREAMAFANENLDSVRRGFCIKGKGKAEELLERLEGARKRFFESLPDWARHAMAAGWKPPKGWKPCSP
jgi:hypothetical protein